MKSYHIWAAALLLSLLFSFNANAQGVGTVGLNTAYGTGVLHSNTSGGGNSGFGYGSLSMNSTGINNSAIGYTALYWNSIGVNNTGIGAYALQNSTVGNSNTALGVVSLYANTSGTNNTALGFCSLYSNTTGSNNIGLGVSAGINLTTGSNNIHIGHPGVTGESNIIRIGDGVTQTDTYLTGVIHGNGSGLTSGSITSAQLANNLTLNGTTIFGGNITATQNVTMNSSLQVNGVMTTNRPNGDNVATAKANQTVLIPEQGDISMGSFHSGPVPVSP